METSLVVQWLRLCASTAGNVGVIPGWETKIPHAKGHSQKNILYALNPANMLWHKWILVFSFFFLVTQNSKL